MAASSTTGTSCWWYELVEPRRRLQIDIDPGTAGGAVDSRARGLAVSSRLDEDFDERASLDLDYIDPLVLLLDLKVLLRTVPTVLRPTGRDRQE
ncbi:MAG: hypothetical protein U0869_01045 [Chloroflexota bacterium]